MTDTTPADELRAAAEKLRPSSPAVAKHAVAVRFHPDVVDALAKWLDAEASGPLADLHSDRCMERGCTINAALAVARQINGAEVRTR